MLSKTGVWRPFSNAAYGANALYVPQWGQPESYEFIFSLSQNFPVFKTHPTLDVWHMYNTGTERFDSSLDYRVTTWMTDLKRGAWSFLYLPDRTNDVRAYLRFYTDNSNRLLVEIVGENPSEENREWQLSLYMCQQELAKVNNWRTLSQEATKVVFTMGKRQFDMVADGLIVSTFKLGDSNDWIHFPFNVENSYFPEIRNDRFRQRLCLTFRPMLIPAGQVVRSTLELIPEEGRDTVRPTSVNLSVREDDCLPYRHEMWEAWHNREYVKSFHGPECVSRPIPGRQWGNFWFWDTGFVAYAAVDFDSQMAREILAELPEPEDCPRKAGSFIPTGIDALWHLYCQTGDRERLAKHYPKFQRMLDYWRKETQVVSEPGMYNKSRGAGSDDNPCSCYCSDFVFSWGYQRTLPRNPQHRQLECIDVEVTSYVLHYLRMLRLMAYELKLDDHVKDYGALIEETESALARHWSEERGCFLYRAGGEKHLLDIEWIGCYNPYFAGMPLTDERRNRMLTALTDARRYWSPYGLTAVAFDNENFRAGGYPNGCVWSPNQFFYWLGFYDRGELNLATELINRYLAMFAENHRRDLMCWEQFRATTGKGSGNARFSSFVTPIVSMWKSHHEPGYLTVGFHTVVLDRDCSQEENWKIELTRPFESGPTAASWVFSRAGRGTMLCNGIRICDFETDQNGFYGWVWTASAGQTYAFQFVFH